MGDRTVDDAVERRAREVMAALEAEGLKQTSRYVYVAALRRAEHWFDDRGSSALTAPQKLIEEYLDGLQPPAARTTRTAITHAWRVGGRDEEVAWRPPPRVYSKSSAPAPAADADPVEHRVHAIVSKLLDEGMKATSASGHRSHLRRAEYWFAERGTTTLEASQELVDEYLETLRRGTVPTVRNSINHAWRVAGRDERVRYRSRTLVEVQAANGVHPSGPSLDSVAGRLGRLLDDLRHLEYASRTIEQYCKEARTADLWCEEHYGMSLRKIPGELLIEYVVTRPKTWSTRKMIRAALGAYWKALGRKNPPLWAIKVPKKPQGVCRALTEEDAAVLAIAARARRDEKGLAVLIALYQALRREEISWARWDWFDKEPGWLTVFGKNEKTRRIPVHPIVAEVLATTERVDPVWLFPGRKLNSSKNRGHVSPATVWAWVRLVAAEAGLGDVNVRPHRLRHTALATVNDNTGNLRATQDFAGHSRPDTTAIYTRTTEAKLREAVMSIVYDRASMPMPSVPYEAVVAGFYGVAAVDGWLQLGAALVAAGGWSFVLEAEGFPSWRADSMPDVWATCDGCDGRLFTLWRSFEAVDEAICWEYSDAPTLVTAALDLVVGRSLAEPSIRLGPWIEQEVLELLAGGGVRAVAVD